MARKRPATDERMDPAGATIFFTFWITIFGFMTKSSFEDLRVHETSAAFGTVVIFFMALAWLVAIGHWIFNKNRW